MMSLNIPLAKKMKAYRSRFAPRIEMKIERLVTVPRQLSANRPVQPLLDLLFISISYLVLPLILYFFPFLSIWDQILSFFDASLI